MGAGIAATARALDRFTDVELVGVLADGNEDVRAAAIYLLGERRVECASAPILQMSLQGDEDPMVQRQALFYFEALDDLESLGVILRSAPDAEVRSEAIVVIARMNSNLREGLIEGGLDDPARRVRREAKRALRQLK